MGLLQAIAAAQDATRTPQGRTTLPAPLGSQVPPQARMMNREELPARDIGGTIRPEEVLLGEMPLSPGDLRGILSMVRRPWLMDSETFLKNNPHDPTGGRASARGEMFDKLPREQDVWVYHATDDATADTILKKGLRQADKPQGLARSNYNSGQAATFGPGNGLGEATYVGAAPVSVEGYGKRILGINTPKGSISPSPEQQLLRADKTAGEALADSDAMLMADVPHNRIVDVTDSGRYIFGHEALTRAAQNAGANIPKRILQLLGIE